MRFLITFLICLLCSSVHGAIDAIQKTVLTTNVYILGTNLFLTNGVLDSLDPYIKNLLTTNSFVLGTNLFLTNGVLESVDSDSAAGITFPLSVANGGTGADLSGVLHGAIPYFDFPSGKFIAPTLIYTNALLWEPTLGTLSIIHTNSTIDPLLILQDNGASAPSIQLYSSRFVVANTNLSLEAVGPFSVDLRVDGSNKVQAVQGGMSLVGKTNIISDDGTALTYNGSKLFPLQSLYTSSSQLGFGSENIIPTNIYSGNLPAGISDLFTVPSGKRFNAITIIIATTNLTSNTSYELFKTNGVYYRYSLDATVGTNSPQGLGFSADDYLFEAGETIAVTNSLAGANTILFGLLFPTNMPMYSPRLLSVSPGNNILYTCPAGKCAVRPTSPNFNPTLFLQYMNDSGANRTNSLYVVPSGGSANSSNIIWTRIVATKTTTSASCGILFPGDSIVVDADANASGKAQLFRISVVEISFP